MRYVIEKPKTLNNLAINKFPLKYKTPEKAAYLQSISNFQKLKKSIFHGILDVHMAYRLLVLDSQKNGQGIERVILKHPKVKFRLTLIGAFKQAKW